jgi:hypothetical protein
MDPVAGSGALHVYAVGCKRGHPLSLQKEPKCTSLMLISCCSLSWLPNRRFRWLLSPRAGKHCTTNSAPNAASSIRPHSAPLLPARVHRAGAARRRWAGGVLLCGPREPGPDPWLGWPIRSAGAPGRAGLARYRRRRQGGQGVRGGGADDAGARKVRGDQAAVPRGLASPHLNQSPTRGPANLPG